MSVCDDNPAIIKLMHILTQLMNMVRTWAPIRLDFPSDRFIFLLCKFDTGHRWNEVAPVQLGLEDIERFLRHSCRRLKHPQILVTLIPQPNPLV